MTPEEFRTQGHAMIDWIVDYLAGVGDHRVQPAIEPGAVRAALPVSPPTEPEPFDRVFADFESIILPATTHWQHPSFFAYFPANSSFPSILGELLSAGLGVNGMSWVTSPAATELETHVLDWMVELLGLPDAFRSTSERGGGVIQATASEATLTSILAARWKAMGGSINSSAVGLERLVAHSSAQAHSSIEKGLRIAGIGTERIRWIDTDDQFAMKPEALAEAIAADRAAGLVPFWVCATLGTTSSTAFDPLPAIGRIARTEGLWLHADGDERDPATLAPEFRWINHGMEFADSYCTNPHKWMGVNFDCDLFWTRDRGALLGALSILPEYLRSTAAEAGAAIDYRDWGIPLGRRFRALKLWFVLRCTGVAATQEMLRRHVALAQELATWVATDERFEIVAPHPVNLVCFRLLDDPDGARTDALIERANATGDALFTRTVLAGRSALRSRSVLATERTHVEAGWTLLQRLADEV
ncbi:MAG: pyridoxal-dependent decarboxylase [Ilumatobacteraceae bacterium]